MEDYLQFDQIDEDVPDIDDMLTTNIMEGGDRYYSYDKICILWHTGRPWKADKKEQSTEVMLSKPAIFLSEVYL